MLQSHEKRYRIKLIKRKNTWVSIGVTILLFIFLSGGDEGDVIVKADELIDTSMISEESPGELSTSLEMSVEEDMLKENDAIPKYINVDYQLDSDESTKKQIVHLESGAFGAGIKSDFNELDTNSTPKLELELTEEENKQWIDVDDPSNIKSLWDNAGKGKDTVIAVIDGGLDLNHEMIVADEETEHGRYPTSQSLQEVKENQKINRGRWVNSKLVFYNEYGDKKLNSFHGTHVAGIVAGNLVNVSSHNLKVQGIAPEAQLLFMKVDVSEPKSYVLAIQDAIHLGADAINISLGVTAEVMVQEISEALKMAKEKGIAVVVAAGNDSFFGGKTHKPLVTNPDFGVIGTPAASADVLTVGAYVPSISIEQIISVDSSHSRKEIPVRIADVPFSQKTFEIVFIDSPADYDYKNVQGKMVLLDYADVMSTEKSASLAKSKGASGIIVYNAYYKKPLLPLKVQENIPVGFISREDADQLRQLASATVRFEIGHKIVKVPGGSQMTDFSSWGLSVSGNIKPDIVAPGYEILSASPDNNYNRLSGTSMASPHMTGIITLFKKYIQKKYPELDPVNHLDLTTKILKSTAELLKDPQTNNYYSPRYQGSGAVNAGKAIAAEAYVSGENGENTINLKNIGNHWTLTANIHNLSSEKKQFDYYATLLTDHVENHRFTASTDKVLETERKTVVVEPNGKQQIILPMNISSIADALVISRPNGYFLDGFIHVIERNRLDKQMNLPFVGFKGVFENLSAVEKPIYSSLDGTFYYRPVNQHSKVDFLLNEIGQIVENSVTGLMTRFTPWSIVEGSKKEGFDLELSAEIPTDDFLGSYSNDKKLNVRTFYFENGQPYLAISPNGDDNMDVVKFKGMFLRNVKHIWAEVFEKGDQTKVLWKSPVTASAIKQYKKGNDGVIEKTSWNGTDQEGNLLKEGEYIYRLHYTPQTEGAKEQTLEFAIKLDMTSLSVPQRGFLDKNSRTLRVEKTQEDDFFSERLFYNYGTEEKPSFALFKNNADGLFIIPEKYEDEFEEVMHNVNLDDLNRFYYVLEDRAGNYTQITLKELLILKAGRFDQDIEENRIVFEGQEINRIEMSGQEKQFKPVSTDLCKELIKLAESTVSMSSSNKSLLSERSSSVFLKELAESKKVATSKIRKLPQTSPVLSDRGSQMGPHCFSTILTTMGIVITFAMMLNVTKNDY